MLDSPTRLPVTIITGFLGSGKTTLLDRILQHNQNLNIAVLLNELGELNIDARLLTAYDDNLVELSNGCICCTINQGLVEAMERILARERQVDRLIIETTGVADPLPIISTVVGSQFRNMTRLDSVVTVVDAASFTAEYDDSGVALKQIRYGDIILLNKTDLVDREQIEMLETSITAVKPNLRILTTSYGAVPLPLLLDVANPPTDSDRSHDGGHSHHLTTDDFTTLSFTSDRPFDVFEFQKFLNERLPKEVFRAKGIVWYGGSKLRHIFQLCGRRFDLKSEPWTTPPSNQLVFIGRHLNRDRLQQLLTNCLL